jgi:hypothetical protein
MITVTVTTKTVRRGDVSCGTGFSGSWFIKANEKCQRTAATLGIPLVFPTEETQQRHGNQLLPPSILHHIGAPGVGIVKQLPEDAFRHDMQSTNGLYPYSDQNTGISLHVAESLRSR